MKERYLKILELGTNATQDEIKKSFRKLALQYHPDRNPSSDAQKRFVEICEAYERLINEDFTETTSSSGQDSNAWQRKYHKNITPEEFEIRLQKAKEYAQQKAYHEEHITTISYAEFKNSYMRHFSAVMIVISTCIFSVISLDYLFLKPIQREGVLMTHAQAGFVMSYLIYDIEGSLQHKKLHPELKDHDVYIKLSARMDGEDWVHVPENMPVTVFITPMLGDYLGFVEGKSSEGTLIPHQYRFHFMFWAYFVIFGAPLAVSFFRGANSFYIVFVYLTSYLSAVTAIFFIINILSHYWS